MNKKIEDAAKQYTNKCQGLTAPNFRYELFEEYNGFIAGAEWALREAIDILKVYKLSSNAIHELEQLLSSEDKNDKP